MNPDKTTMTVYHGTTKKALEGIKAEGLKGNIHDAGWYMVSTDFSSALFHAMPDTNEDAIVIEFEVEIDREALWKGYPKFWPAYERTEESHWHALHEELPADSIRTVHSVPFPEFMNQKSCGFDKPKSTLFKERDAEWDATRLEGNKSELSPS